MSLDQEIQLERDLIEEEYRPIAAAWDNYVPKATWNQHLPMYDWQPEPYWHLRQDQIDFIRHLAFHGEIGVMEATGLALHANKFETAYEIHKAKWGECPIDKIVQAMDLMYELRIRPGA